MVHGPARAGPGLGIELAQLSITSAQRARLVGHTILGLACIFYIITSLVPTFRGISFLSWGRNTVGGRVSLKSEIIKREKKLTWPD